jgi:hypothetical protein
MKVSVMEHERHFTLEEAGELLPWARECLGRVREALECLTQPSVRDALAKAAEVPAGGYPGREAAGATLAMQLLLSQLHEAGIVVRDPAQGLIDFPSLRDGREVYLCWHEGETEIGFWHEPDAGFAGRRPL